MNEAEIKREARLYALEVLVCQLHVMFYRAQYGDSGVSFAVLARSAVVQAHAQRLTFPSLDPAMSDLFAAEIEAAVSRLQKMQQDLLETGPQQGSGQ